MNPQRRLDICGSCGDEAEIAGHGLCYRCYRRVERQAAYAKDGWNPGDTRKQKRLARAHAKLIEGLLDFGAGTHANATSLINIIAGELMPLAEFLGNDMNVNNGKGSRSQDAPEKEEGGEGPDVNIEQSSRSQGEPTEEECPRAVDTGPVTTKPETKKNPKNTKVSRRRKPEKARRKTGTE